MEIEESTIARGRIAVDRGARRTPRQRSNSAPADSVEIMLRPSENGSGPRVATGKVAGQPAPRSNVKERSDSDTRTRREGLLHSESVRAGLAAVGSLVGAVVVVAILHAMDIVSSPTVVTVLVVPLFVYGVVSGRLHELTAPGGWRATFDEVKRQQELQASDIESIRVALRGLVSKYELQHLHGLATKNPFIVNYGKEFYNELKRLDDFGFLLPHPGLERGLYTVFERFGQEENAPLEDRTKFNLHDYVVITPEGDRYLQLYRATTS